MKEIKRAIIYAKDIQNITGKHERTARRIISNIRREYGKPKGSPITLREFCQYMGISEEDALRCLLA